jgi:hypothetical protein
MNRLVNPLTLPELRIFRAVKPAHSKSGKASFNNRNGAEMDSANPFSAVVLFVAALIVTSIFAVAITACQPGTEPPTVRPASSQGGENLGETYPVDPLFEEFYAFLGGQELLGPALTPLIESKGLKTQYVQAALLVYEATAAENERYRLAPLGVQLGIAEPPAAEPADAEVVFLNGHTVYEAFLPLFEQLGGARFVGKPMTEARHNPEDGRIEQYFENLGFYQLEQEPAGMVRLLAYGAYACDQRCRYLAPSASLPAVRPVLPEPFSAQAARMGIEITGRILAEPYLSDDGRVEVIFENMVMTLEAGQPGEARAAGGKRQPAAPPTKKFQTRLPVVFLSGEQEAQSARRGQVIELIRLPRVMGERPAPVQSIGFRPLAQLLDMANQPPVSRREDPLLVFYPVEGSLGYHVPAYFHGFLERLGGLEVSGLPASELFEIGAGLYRQCFANLCLDFEPGAEENPLRLAPLGYLYKERFFVQPGRFVQSGSLEGVELRVWESRPYIGGEQGVASMPAANMPAASLPMAIHLAVMEAGKPLPNREASLTVRLPDGSQDHYRVQPTNERGQAFFTLPPIPALNGMLIPYQVCLEGLQGEQLCVDDYYLVWEYE